MTKIIKVTEQHIRLGEPKRAFYCPVARAIKEALNCESVGVIRWSCNIDGGRGIDFPPAVTKFISRFDAGMPVAPFEFELEIPVNTAEKRGKPMP